MLRKSRSKSRLTYEWLEPRLLMAITPTIKFLGEQDSGTINLGDALHVDATSSFTGTDLARNSYIEWDSNPT